MDSYENPVNEANKFVATIKDDTKAFLVAAAPTAAMSKETYDDDEASGSSFDDTGIGNVQSDSKDELAAHLRITKTKQTVINTNATSVTTNNSCNEREKKTNEQNCSFARAGIVYQQANSLPENQKFVRMSEIKVEEDEQQLEIEQNTTTVAVAGHAFYETSAEEAAPTCRMRSIITASSPRQENPNILKSIPIQRILTVPKITITGPPCDSPSETIVNSRVGRLEDVKRILNRQILQKSGQQQPSNLTNATILYSTTTTVTAPRTIDAMASLRPCYIKPVNINSNRHSIVATPATSTGVTDTTTTTKCDSSQDIDIKLLPSATIVASSPQQQLLPIMSYAPRILPAGACIRPVVAFLPRKPSICNAPSITNAAAAPALSSNIPKLQTSKLLVNTTASLLPTTNRIDTTNLNRKLPTKNILAPVKSTMTIPNEVTADKKLLTCQQRSLPKSKCVQLFGIGSTSTTDDEQSKLAVLPAAPKPSKAANQNRDQRTAAESVPVPPASVSASMSTTSYTPVLHRTSSAPTMSTESHSKTTEKPFKSAGLHDKTGKASTMTSPSSQTSKIELSNSNFTTSTHDTKDATIVAVTATTKSEKHPSNIKPNIPIVLENKLLMPNEKIDLKALHLPREQTTNVKLAKTNNTLRSRFETYKKLKRKSNFLTMQEKQNESEIPSSSLTPSPGKCMRVVVSNAQLKKPKADLVMLAKKIHEKTVTPVTSTPMNDSSTTINSTINTTITNATATASPKRMHVVMSNSKLQKLTDMTSVAKKVKALLTKEPAHQSNVDSITSQTPQSNEADSNVSQPLKSCIPAYTGSQPKSTESTILKTPTPLLVESPKLIIPKASVAHITCNPDSSSGASSNENLNDEMKKRIFALCNKLGELRRKQNVPKTFDSVNYDDDSPIEENSESTAVDFIASLAFNCQQSTPEAKAIAEPRKYSDAMENGKASNETELIEPKNNTKATSLNNETLALITLATEKPTSTDLSDNGATIGQKMKSVSNAASKTVRKRIGIKNAPINLVSRKKPHLKNPTEAEREQQSMTKMTATTATSTSRSDKTQDSITNDIEKQTKINASTKPKDVAAKQLEFQLVSQSKAPEINYVGKTVEMVVEKPKRIGNMTQKDSCNEVSEIDSFQSTPINSSAVQIVEVYPNEVNKAEMNTNEVQTRLEPLTGVTDTAINSEKTTTEYENQQKCLPELRPQTVIVYSAASAAKDSAEIDIMNIESKEEKEIRRVAEATSSTKSIIENELDGQQTITLSTDTESLSCTRNVITINEPGCSPFTMVIETNNNKQPLVPEIGSIIHIEPLEPMAGMAEKIETTVDTTLAFELGLKNKEVLNIKHKDEKLKAVCSDKTDAEKIGEVMLQLEPQSSREIVETTNDNVGMQGEDDMDLEELNTITMVAKSNKENIRNVSLESEPQSQQDAILPAAGNEELEKVNTSEILVPRVRETVKEVALSLKLQPSQVLRETSEEVSAKRKGEENIGLEELKTDKIETENMKKKIAKDTSLELQNDDIYSSKEVKEPEQINTSEIENETERENVKTTALNLDSQRNQKLLEVQSGVNKKLVELLKLAKTSDEKTTEASLRLDRQPQQAQINIDDTTNILSDKDDVGLKKTNLSEAATQKLLGAKAAASSVASQSTRQELLKNPEDDGAATQGEADMDLEELNTGKIVAQSVLPKSVVQPQAPKPKMFIPNDNCTDTTSTDDADSPVLIKRRRLRRRKRVRRCLSTSESDEQNDDEMVSDSKSQNIVSRSKKTDENTSTSQRVEETALESNMEAQIESQQQQYRPTLPMPAPLSTKHRQQVFACHFTANDNRRNVPLKKRWDLTQQQQRSQGEATDITDDTSPVHDDDTVDDDNEMKQDQHSMNQKELEVSEDLNKADDMNPLPEVPSTTAKTTTVKAPSSSGIEAEEKSTVSATEPPVLRQRKTLRSAAATEKNPNSSVSKSIQQRKQQQQSSTKSVNKLESIAGSTEEGLETVKQQMQEFQGSTSATPPSTNIETPEEPATAKQPHKRGRPKRNKSIEANEKSTNETLNTTNELTEKSRTKKMKFMSAKSSDDVEGVAAVTPIQETPMNESELATSTPQLLRKRGRSSQTVKATTSLISLKPSGSPKDVVPTESKASLELNKLLSSQPRKRGRPSRNPQNLNQTLPLIGGQENDSVKDTESKKATRQARETTSGVSATQPESELVTHSTASITQPESELTASISSVLTTPEPQTKKGRGRWSHTPVNVGDFNPRLLLIRKRQQLDSDEVLTVPTAEAGTAPLQCGLCLARTTAARWSAHLREHYGVGWIVGKEPPIDVTTRSLVLKQITAFFKQHTSTVSCRICAHDYRSSLGLLLHIENCGAEQARFPCPNCQKEYTKLSLVSHLRSCGQQKEIQSEIEETMTAAASEITDDDVVFNNAGRRKRVSLIKAESKLRNITKVLVEADNTEFNPKNHIKQAIDPSLDGKMSYSCTICIAAKSHFATEAEAIKHVIKCHKSSSKKASDFEADTSDYAAVSTEEDSEENESTHDEESNVRSENESDSANKSSHTNKSSLPPVYPPRTQNVPEMVRKKWNQFIQANYAKTVLYPKALTTYSAVVGATAELLPVQLDSIKFAISPSLKIGKNVETKGLKWQSLQRFETMQIKNLDKLIYLGAPIKLLAWVPLPANETSAQYLVVAFRKDFTRFEHPEAAKTLLLVYKITNVNSGSEELKSDFEIDIHYALHVPNGPVHALAFLPSGGYDVSMNRLGLLAIGTMHNKIEIYALPIEPLKFESINCHALRVIELSPNIELALMIADSTDPDEIEQNSLILVTQCLKICWSEYAGHQHIFASFSNGFVATWYIKESENGARNFNCYCEATGKQIFTPINYFQCFEKFAQDIAVHYDTNGPRWLAVMGYTCNLLIVYDILNITQPLPIKEEVLKNVPSQLDWSPVWESLAVGLGDCITNNGRSVIAHNPVGLSYVNSKITNMLCGVSQVHYSPLQCLHACGTDNGDIVFINTREMYYDLNVMIRAKNDAFAIALMNVARLDGEPLLQPKKVTTEPKEEKDSKHIYGLVFGATLKFNLSERSAYLSEQRLPPRNIERIMRTNALRWNLNVTGKRFIAIGYENGFLRVNKLKRELYFKQ